MNIRFCVGHAALAVISDAGHCPQFENSAELQEALARFLATIAPVDRAGRLKLTPTFERMRCGHSWSARPGFG